MNLISQDASMRCPSTSYSSSSSSPSFSGADSGVMSMRRTSTLGLVALPSAPGLLWPSSNAAASSFDSAFAMEIGGSRDI
eukprot:CAMPEP_0182548002 /NCGR_PEP_ID=MMETSP1323-20130603/38221_1 /TAXON_ID=236787 /ORGANISM="Florenciella parvula, Strain RCC1693" /LENGTH=79 /DNA_ID=CAMNT_0024759357 /DNA_START=265 /DNA_END=504 /DNA_ORIENTATION=+